MAPHGSGANANAPGDISIRQAACAKLQTLAFPRFQLRDRRQGGCAKLGGAMVDDDVGDLSRGVGFRIDIGVLRNKRSRGR